MYRFMMSGRTSHVTLWHGPVIAPLLIVAIHT